MNTRAETRPVTERIPEHLQAFIAQQDPTMYTAIDHAGWRYILRVSRRFFGDHAHQKYLDGLAETGIATERIPLISEMDACLRRFGWRAVGVVGFIPPAAFMEFQSLGILPIACDMRQLDHLAYTPAPDIVHEAAGHAPIIADPDYADYLRAYGEVARKAIFSKKDMDVYFAIRNLSDVKEDPESTQTDIRAAQERLDRAVAALDYVSEATYLARMNWWTVEYGLIGDPQSPKIYGAGLLSSVGESYHCLKNDVKRVPLTLDCLNVSYDITRPQPQLFVTPDFSHLTRVLEQFAATMAFRLGGIDGLTKAKLAATPTTAVLDSGLQISGVLSDFMDGRAPFYLQYTGPVQLAYADQEIENHGPATHSQGFGTPIGTLANGRSPATLRAEDLKKTSEESGAVTLRFSSGVEVTGRCIGGLTKGQDQTVLLRFENCTVRMGKQILFQPEWGVFDMACGTQVVSVFGGAADRGKYLAATGGYPHKPARPKTNLTPENKPLCALYQKVRDVREGRIAEDSAPGVLSQTYAELCRQFPDDWLLRLELLELAELARPTEWKSACRADLTRIGRASPEKSELIARGLEILHSTPKGSDK